VLGVAPTATDKEIQRAYRRAARAAHPDAHPDADPALIVAINEAWAVLGDPAARAEYDRLHPIPPSPGWNPPAVPRGFELYPRPGGLARSAGFPHARFADERLRALSLAAEGPDLSGLADVPTDAVWHLDATRPGTGDDQLRFVTPLTELRVLDLSDTAITDAGLRQLSRMPWLRDLLVFGTTVTDAGLAYLNGMTELDLLDLRRTRIEGPGLRHLHGLQDLVELRLPHVDRASLAALRTALPDVRLV